MKIVDNNIGVYHLYAVDDDAVDAFIRELTDNKDSDIVKIHRVDSEARMPLRATKTSAGFDIYSVEDVTLMSMIPTLIRTGLVFELSDNYEAQIRSRSGLALKGIVVANSPGTIDSDYRGHVRVLLINFNKEDYEVKRGDRIAQVVFQKLSDVELVEVSEVDETKRGSGGFGSTGK